jgi:hypothetical protein
MGLTTARNQKFEAKKQELGDGIFMDVKNLNEYEDATCIEIAVLLTANNLKRWFLVPILSILTLFYFPVRLYWNKRMQERWFYSRATGLADATHVFIVGRGKC